MKPSSYFTNLSQLFHHFAIKLNDLSRKAEEKSLRYCKSFSIAGKGDYHAQVWFSQRRGWELTITKESPVFVKIPSPRIESHESIANAFHVSLEEVEKVEKIYQEKFDRIIGNKKELSVYTSVAAGLRISDDTSNCGALFMMGINRSHVIGDLSTVFPIFSEFIRVVGSLRKKKLIFFTDADGHGIHRMVLDKGFMNEFEEGTLSFTNPITNPNSKNKIFAGSFALKNLNMPSGWVRSYQL